MTNSQENTKEDNPTAKVKVGLLKKIWRGYKYSLVGNWDEHKDRLERLKKHLSDDKAKSKEISDVLSQIEDEKSRFDSLIFLRGFSESDIANTRHRYAIEIVLFSIFFITTICFFIYNAVNDFNVITCIGCLLAVMLWGVKVLHSWWRLTQLSERRLMSFASWMRG